MTITTTIQSGRTGVLHTDSRFVIHYKHIHVIPHWYNNYAVQFALFVKIGEEYKFLAEVKDLRYIEEAYASKT